MKTSLIPSLPMYFPPNSTGFNLSDAQNCAALVGVAYQQLSEWTEAKYPPQSSFSSNTKWQGKEPPGWSGSTPQGFTYGEPIWSSFKITILGRTAHFSEPFGFIATDGNGNAYVVFRGTMTTADGIMDAEVDQTTYKDVSGFGKVHDGFWGVYQGLRKQLLDQVNALSDIATLYFTGHSMGSGLSSLAIPDIINNSNLASGNKPTIYHYNFASPRVGNLTFAAAMNALSLPSFRIVNTEDIVPDGPLAVTGSIMYQHFGYPLDFTAQYGSIDGNHSMADAYAYAISHPENPLNPNPAPLDNVVIGKGIGPGSLPRSLVIPATHVERSK